MNLSLITSCFNCGKFLNELADSIISQTYTDWTWTLIDDYSTDDTESIINNVVKRDKRIKIAPKKHKKHYWWNPQLLATGDIVCPIDADDKLLPTSLEQVCFYFKEFPDAILLHFNANTFNETFIENNFIKNVYITNLNNSFLEGFENLGFRSNIFGYLRVFRNIKGLIFDEHEDIPGQCSSNDGQWLLRLEELGQWLTIPRTSYLARQHLDSENFRNWSIQGEVKLILDTRKRRKDNSLTTPCNIKYFDSIYRFAESTYLSQFNNEIKSTASFWGDVSLENQNKLKKLFFNHTIIFNQFAPYIFLCLDLDSSLDIIQRAKSYDFNELIIFFYNTHLFKSNRGQESLIDKTKKLLGDSAFYHHEQENRTSFIIKSKQKSFSDVIINSYNNIKVNTCRIKETTYNINFVDGGTIEVVGNDDRIYDIGFFDKENLIYNTELKPGCWAKTARKYFTNFNILVKHQNQTLLDYNYNANNERVLIHLDSSSLGDTIAWFPYVEEFRKQHQCQVFCSTFWNELFDKEYPDINFISPGSVVDNLYAMYWIGIFNDNNREIFDYRTIPLQQIGSSILGIHHYEIKPRIVVRSRAKKIQGRYACFAMTATSKAKLWNNPNGWKGVIEFLHSSGIKPVLIQKERDDNIKSIINLSGEKTIHETTSLLINCDFFIGVGSGLSWLAWALGKPTVLISGFSDPFAEFSTPYRIINKNVCHGCYNDINHKFDKGNWNWCPRNKDFECTSNISSRSVIEVLTKLV